MFREEIEPLYFGSPDRPLFGCYHPPQSELKRNCGLVCCYPMGEEYIRFHRTFRQLADRLAKDGFPVLRFDFYGCGDSAGDREQGHPVQWLEDIEMAIAEILKKPMVEKVGLVGLRLGAALSIMSGIEHETIDGMILWDPVINGKRYLKELQTLHTEMLSYAHVKPKHDSIEKPRQEILGFPYTNSLLEELECIDLLGLQKKPANKILIIESHEKVNQEQLYMNLQRLNISVEYRQFPSPQIWVWKEAFGKVRVPHQILQSIVSWLSKVYQ